MEDRQSADVTLRRKTAQYLDSRFENMEDIEFGPEVVFLHLSSQLEQLRATQASERCVIY